MMMTTMITITAVIKIQMVTYNNDPVISLQLPGSKSTPQTEHWRRIRNSEKQSSKAVKSDHIAE